MAHNAMYKVQMEQLLKVCMQHQVHMIMTVQICIFMCDKSGIYNVPVGIIH